MESVSGSVTVMLCERAFDLAGVGVGVVYRVGASGITVVLYEGGLDFAGIGVHVAN